eukprot:UN33347
MLYIRIFIFVMPGNGTWGVSSAASSKHNSPQNSSRNNNSPKSFHFPSSNPTNKNKKERRTSDEGLGDLLDEYYASDCFKPQEMIEKSDAQQLSRSTSCKRFMFKDLLKTTKSGPMRAKSLNSMSDTLSGPNGALFKSKKVSLSEKLDTDDVVDDFPVLSCSHSVPVGVKLGRKEIPG